MAIWMVCTFVVEFLFPRFRMWDLRFNVSIAILLEEKWPGKYFNELLESFNVAFRILTNYKLLLNLVFCVFSAGDNIKILSGCGDCELNNSYADTNSTISDHIKREGTICNDTSSLNNFGSMCNSISDIDTIYAVACCREDTCNVSKHIQTDTDGQRGTMKYTNPITVDEDQENKTLYLNSGNLSENIKVCYSAPI